VEKKETVAVPSGSRVYESPLGGRWIGASVITDKILEQRAKSGDADALFRLAYRLAFGRNRPRRPWRRILRFWLAAAEENHTRAQFYVGTCYEHGHGVDADLETAIRWYEKAASQGHAQAQYNLAFSYGEGSGKRRNPSRAFHWMHLAAENELPDAMRDLGYYYFHGVGVRVDQDEGTYWYRRAARLGDTRSAFNLGLCYLSGDGVTMSKRLALKWLRRAASHGHAGAQNQLVELSRGMRSAK